MGIEVDEIFVNARLRWVGTLQASPTRSGVVSGFGVGPWGWLRGLVLLF